jgi:hypothetical protein
VHNATEIEKRGTPAIVICTRPFAKTAASMAKRQGYPNYPVSLLPHPVANATPDEVARLAQEALPHVLAIALGSDRELLD